MRAAMNAVSALRRAVLCLCLCFGGAAAAAQPPGEIPPEAGGGGTGTGARAVSTYSVVAVDRRTGEIGAAVLSHWFSVGSLVTWGEAGVGAVATHGFPDPGYGPEGLQAMRQGASAGKALRRLLRKDEDASIRQLAFVDSDGDVASHTGDLTMAGACESEGSGYSVQANGVEPDALGDVQVCGVMAAHFQYGEGDLAARMIAALEAGAAGNGEIDAAQRRSAAIIVVGKERRAEPWQGRLIDLRVDDRTGALGELKRLVATNRALNLMREGDAWLAAGEPERANAAFDTAMSLAPGHDEMIFWRAVSLAAAGGVEGALAYFETAFNADPQWRRLVGRLPASVLLPDDPQLIARILAVGGAGGSESEYQPGK